ncbi:hypothetical protein FRUB_03528 [Fimbriiglobus ruber]|uniref:Uncharacterized protein n=1 Tax=Fimbriiglobus ruber TaxID=1908690 RepID=A0A225E364_9BACT|nr:hypothetical protein FRUB_03528 [Fimbriiglobus ruber]
MARRGGCEMVKQTRPGDKSRAGCVDRGLDVGITPTGAGHGGPRL